MERTSGAAATQIAAAEKAPMQCYQRNANATRSVSRKRQTSPAVALVAITVGAAIAILLGAAGSAPTPISSRATTGATTSTTASRSFSLPWPTLVVVAEAFEIDEMNDESATTTSASSSSTIQEEEEPKITTTTKTEEDEAFDEEVLVQETIKAGRGDREEQGVRDQWVSDEHLNDRFDSRKPISMEVRRLLKAYRLECKGCDHQKAVRTVNAYVQETKRLGKLEQQQQLERDQKDARTRRMFGALVVVLLSCAYFYKEQLSESLGQLSEQLGLDTTRFTTTTTSDFDGFSKAQRTELMRMRQQQAATQRLQQQQQQQQQVNPTWLDNEKKEVWTPKQEKQFQTALKEFFGVPKKERYRLIAEKVQGKSRIECLTHHRMQELLLKREQYQQ
uniref:Myb-like domain-containing protein n=1 Tax=Pseudo-nitzschia australis TaxID=44445 RepID=A0A7S4EKJ9_9STRA|mmetsp:Transcript_2189/g.4688  ORF Transcript_2189/g.4688 Transcript_2189/m.4688 type:complete len:391 (+) Transcript_2189:146-1318(+)